MLDEEAESEDSGVIDIAAVGRSDPGAKVWKLGGEADRSLSVASDTGQGWCRSSMCPPGGCGR